MAAAAKTQGGTPHTSSNKLEDQGTPARSDPERMTPNAFLAATAALYVTRGKGKSKSSHPILDEDGKLSLAGSDPLYTCLPSAGANTIYNRCRDFAEICSTSRPPLISFSRIANRFCWRGCDFSRYAQEDCRALETWVDTCCRESCIPSQGLRS